jgi:hypothetical protein
MWKQKVHVHTEGYEISLSRDLSVCRSTIKRIHKTLELLEQKHNLTTEAFMEEVRTGRLREDPDLKDDHEAWKSSCESLKKWEELEKQYVEMYKTHETSEPHSAKKIIAAGITETTEED